MLEPYLGCPSAHPPDTTSCACAYGLITATIAAAPATPSPYAPGLWGLVVVVIVLVATVRLAVAKRRA